MLQTGWKISFAVLFFILIHMLPIRKLSEESMRDIIPIVTFGYFGYLTSTIFFFMVSFAIPASLLGLLIKSIHRIKNEEMLVSLKIRYYYEIFISCFIVYMLDFFQDVALKYLKKPVDKYTPPIYMKYIIHQLFAPIFFIDIVYNLAEDKKNSILPRNKKLPKKNFVYFILENTLVLLYMSYAIGMCYSYYKGVYPSFKDMIQEQKPYFLFQLLSSALLLFVYVLFFQSDIIKNE